MMLVRWLSVQATPELPEPALRGLDAVSAAHGWSIAALGMSVVFVALFLLFLMMIGLRRVLEARPVPRDVRPAPAPVAEAPPARGADEGPSPRLVAAIVTAVRLEQQRRASVAQAPVPGPGSGWVVSRSLQWAAHQSIFSRPRR